MGGCTLTPAQLPCVHVMDVGASCLNPLEPTEQELTQEEEEEEEGGEEKEEEDVSALCAN